MSGMAVLMSTTTGTSLVMPSPSGAAGTADMDMGMNTCKISMSWNWYTVGACFISDKWQITSSAMFGGVMVGIILLVISLELLRRLQREHDKHIRRLTKVQYEVASSHYTDAPLEGATTIVKSIAVQSSTTCLTEPNVRLSRPTRMTLLLHQTIRAALHMLQFGVAYLIMLLAMYYNGYVIMCIILGAFLGSFIFTWDQLYDASSGEVADVTGCCG